MEENKCLCPEPIVNSLKDICNKCGGIQPKKMKITKEEIDELLKKAPENNPHYYIGEMCFQKGIIYATEKMQKELYPNDGKKEKKSIKTNL